MPGPSICVQWKLPGFSLDADRVNAWDVAVGPKILTSLASNLTMAFGSMGLVSSRDLVSKSSWSLQATDAKIRIMIL